MLPGYNTNGFAHHRLEDALEILAGIGFQSVALTLDHHALDPYDARSERQADAVREILERLHLNVVIETGARFLLDPYRKHRPTLLDPDPALRNRRADYLRRAAETAVRLGADTVSFWSGGSDTAEPYSTLAERLTQECQSLADYAADRGVRLAFEPEPGMFIDTMARFEELFDRVDHPAFGLTLDAGHLHCQGELPIADHIRRWKEVLWNVHLEDMRAGVHDHLMFGEGEMDFPPIFQALHEVGYKGGLHVELSRHSHDAVETARRACAFIVGQASRLP
jgi:sugar phosphate isomerase/epimerase